jgi:hypothetical protein
MPYVARNAKEYLSKSVGSGQCVAFVQAAAQTGHTSGWTKGERVQGAELTPGTAIATFSSNGKYGNDTHGNSHAAIYLGQDADGLNVYDQWMYAETDANGKRVMKPQKVSERTIRFAPNKKAVNDGRNYFVIE